jgi:hypothetical protein
MTTVNSLSSTPTKAEFAASLAVGCPACGAASGLACPGRAEGACRGRVHDLRARARFTSRGGVDGSLAAIAELAPDVRRVLEALLQPGAVAGPRGGGLPIWIVQVRAGGRVAGQLHERHVEFALERGLVRCANRRGRVLVEVSPGGLALASRLVGQVEVVESTA